MILEGLRVTVRDLGLFSLVEAGLQTRSSHHSYLAARA
jgi:hypothetical protein